MEKTIIKQDPSRRWTAVHTKARCEKIAADYCNAYEITNYLPLRLRAKRYQRRTVKTYIPMFAGYVFVQIDYTEKQLLSKFGKIAHILPIDEPGEVRLIRELQNIQKIEKAAEEEELIVKPEIVPGRPVRVIGGALQGSMGIVERRGSKMRVTVNVDLLGQSVAVELDVGDIETEE